MPSMDKFLQGKVVQSVNQKVISEHGVSTEKVVVAK